MGPTASAAQVVQPDCTLAVLNVRLKFVVGFAAPESQVVIS